MPSPAGRPVAQPAPGDDNFEPDIEADTGGGLEVNGTANGAANGAVHEAANGAGMDLTDLTDALNFGAVPTWKIKAKRRSESLMSLQDHIDEMKQHDVSTSALDGIKTQHAHHFSGDEMKVFLKQMCTVNENIVKNMDASTEINPIAIAWGETDISWKDVSFKVKDKDGSDKKILMNCNGHIPAGNLAALMGPSGCGKSTLLDIIAQKKSTPYEGTVYCNGHDIRGDKFFKRYAAYVSQSDEMHEMLTVRETLLMTMFLKNPPPKTIKGDDETKNATLDVFLSVLGLRHVQNTIIGGEKSGMRGISGGQKRRVTLARGAITGTQLLFADEPTSGLSATDAESCIKMLRFLCKRFGLTAVVVIHQPRVEVAELFDQLFLLTADPSQYGGSTVYNGLMGGTVDYCADVGYPVPNRANPADWFLDMISPGYAHVLVKKGEKEVDESVKDFVQFFIANMAKDIAETIKVSIAAPGTHPIDSVYKKWTRVEQFLNGDIVKETLELKRSGHAHATSRWTQFVILLAVKIKLLRRDKQGLRMRFGMSLAQAFIVGLAFQDIASKPQVSHIQFIFMAMQLSCISGMQIMPGLVDARNIMKSDHDEGLHTISSWIFGNCIIEAILTWITGIMFIAILFAFGGMPWDNFSAFLGWSLLVITVMDSYFNLVAAVAKTGQLATVMALPLFIMSILYNGFLVSRKSAPEFMVWALYVSPFYYAITSLTMALYGPDNCDEMGCAIAISTYEFDGGPSDTVSLVFLIGLSVVFRVLQVICLGKLNNPEK